MTYYEELVRNLENFINTKQYIEAEELINSELRLPYIPSNVYDKLVELKDLIPKNETKLSLNDEEIEEYLKSSNEKQLIAVEVLNHKNLRDYIDLCNEYLTNKGFINAKVLLIESLIKQDISDEINFNNDGLEYSFIPRYIMLPEESDGYKTAINRLNELFMKEPSKLEIAKSLVYKECIMALPINLDETEGFELANKVYKYVLKAFGEDA